MDALPEERYAKKLARQRERYKEIMNDPEASEEFKKKQQEYKQACQKDPQKKARQAAWSHRWHHSLHGVAWQYRNAAQRRRLEWALTDEQAIALFRTSCHYCGIPPNPRNGIDRKDNAVGYTTENVLPCCSVCNYAKRTMSYAEFLAWLERAAKHIAERK